MSAPPAGADPGPSPRRQRIWVTVILATGLLAAGVLGATLTAQSVSRRSSERAQEAFDLSSVEIAATLRLAIHREEDLAVSATGFFLGTPYATNKQFLTWANTVRAMDRYPELLGWGEVVMVTPAQLEAYKAIVAADPAQVVTGTFELIPPGDRPFYCLFSSGQSRTPASGAPPGFDYCAGAPGLPILAARDSGLSSYQSIDTGNGAGRTLAVQVPFYLGGITPTTVEARRAAFAGWVGIGFDPKLLLDQALTNRPDTAVALRFQDASSSADFASGDIPAGAEHISTDLGNSWTVEAYAVVESAGIVHDRGALIILLTGIAASLILAALVLVLGTGRAAALRLVGERTGELRHQALHDALTGLPNRTLIMDRIDQLLTRNRRHNTNGAALYIDLDDFKNVNDTLGHEAGDRLLVAVAAPPRRARCATSTRSVGWVATSSSC